MLGRVLPIPDRTKYGLMDSFPLESKWHITGSKNCEASGKPIQIPPFQLRLLVRAPTNVTLRGNSFHAWTEFKGNDQPNLLVIMVLAWSYILSARLMELQPPSLPASQAEDLSWDFRHRHLTRGNLVYSFALLFEVDLLNYSDICPKDAAVRRSCNGLSISGPSPGGSADSGI